MPYRPRGYICPYCGRKFRPHAYSLATFRAHVYGRGGKRPAKGCKEKTTAEWNRLLD